MTVGGLPGGHFFNPAQPTPPCLRDSSSPVTTVRARLKSLIGKQLLKIVGLLNLSERPELIAAIVGINANTQGHLDDLMKQIANLPFVTSVSIVTGRFDLIVEVLVAGDIQDLYRFTSELLPRVAAPGVISRSETFVVMKSHDKWVNLPRGCWEESADGADTGAALTKQVNSL